MEKNIENLLQKRKTIAKKLICIVLVLTFGLPLSGFTMETHAQGDLLYIDTVPSLCHFEDDRYYETTFNGLSVITTDEVVVDCLQTLQDTYTNESRQLLSDDTVTQVLGSEELDDTYLYETISMEALCSSLIYVDEMQNITSLPGRETRDLEHVMPMSPTLTISPTTNWTNIPAAGGTQRTVTITTNVPLGNVTITRPQWLNITVTGNRFTLTAQQNTIAASRTGTVSVTGGGITRNFTVTQLAAATNLTISPVTNWNNVPAIGGSQRRVIITTNVPLGNVTVIRPSWLDTVVSGNSFTLTAQRNTVAEPRMGTVLVAGGGVTRSFTVTQLAATATLTISPTADWVNLPVAGGSQRRVTITTNIPLGNVTVTRPPWLNNVVSGNSFTLTTQSNPFISARVGTVTVSGGGISRSFTVMQLSNPPIDFTEPFVIACYRRLGYMDVNSSNATSTIVECVERRNARRPMWRIVHLNSNIYAIRNETTGRYLTETNGNLRHEARIGNTGSNNRQRWAFELQSNGSFRIRSISNTSLFITESNSPHFTSNPNIGLATSNTSHNRQFWWVDLIWRSNYNEVFFWPDTINIMTHPALGSPPASFNFPTRMQEARTAWSNALGVSLNTTTNVNNANIQAFGGPRGDMIREAGRFVDAGLAVTPGHIVSPAGGIRAEGEWRSVGRLDGRGNGNTVNMFVVSNFTTAQIRMIAIHELGHALGFRGHAPPHSHCIMIPELPPNPHPSIELSAAERAHLRQIYVLFR